MKQTIKLTQTELKEKINEAVKRKINELYAKPKPRQKQNESLDSRISRALNESLRKILKENEEGDFNPQGYKGISNLGGMEIEIDRRGDAARFKYPSGEVTDWTEIVFDDSDEEGSPYCELEGGREYLADYMRY